jgi:AGCS family alanine or glycine:cation symporter
LGTLEDIDAFVNEYPDTYLWYLAFFVIIGAGLYLTFKLKGVQIVQLRRANQLVIEDAKRGSPRKGISSFEAFCVSMGARIGIGNIAGVTIALVSGGPGALFWMWIFAIIGAASSFAETVLGQLFKEKRDDGLFHGGPAFYIKNGLKRPGFAAFMACMIIVTYGIGFIGVQASNAASSFSLVFPGVENWVFALILAIIAAVIFIGGIKRVAKVSTWMVPAMALGWLVVAIMAILVNYDQIGHAFALIFQGAFSAASFAGGVGGWAMMWGLKRGVFSNEAGIGSIPNVSSAADVSHPCKQGLIQAVGVFIDTIVVCTATALVVLTDPNYSSLGLTGAPLVQKVLQNGYLGDAAPAVLMVFMVVFAFSSLIGYYSMSEANLRFLRRGKNSDKHIVMLRVMIVTVVLVSCVIPLTLVWDICDVFMAMMGICNMIAVLLLSGYVVRLYADYRRQLKAGVAEPEFNRVSIKDMDTEGITQWDRHR